MGDGEVWQVGWWVCGASSRRQSVVPDGGCVDGQPVSVADESWFMATNGSILSSLTPASSLIIVVILSVAALACAKGECEPGRGPMALSPDGGIESCNGLDDDSDGQVDESDPSVGTICGSSVGACTIGVLTCHRGALACNGEPGSHETCNGVDDDCDGRVDESFSTKFYLDADLDGSGSDEQTCQACAADDCPGGGPWVTEHGDCNDDCASCFVGALEVCDTLDNDCDGDVDEGTQVPVFVDVDGDGFGTGEETLTCLGADAQPPRGFALRDGDCADEDPRANPGATMRFSTQVRGVDDDSIDFDFNCDGREERLHEPCRTCRNGACWLSLSEPFREGDPPCGTLARAQRSDLLALPGRAPLCVQGRAYEDVIVACR